MAFVVIGIILLVLKILGVGFAATLSWWWVLLPFALAFVWWEIVDPMFALSQKRAMREMGERAQARRDKYRESLGLGAARSKDRKGK